MSAKEIPIKRRGMRVYVSFDYARRVKIEASLTYRSEWRGQDAIVALDAKRYTTSEGRLTEWFVYPTGATTAEDVLSQLTDTAKQRLGDACDSDAMEWLTSDEGTAAVQLGYYREARRELMDKGPRYGRDYGRRLMATWRDGMGPALTERFGTFVKAWEAWHDAVEASDSSKGKSDAS